MCTPDTLPPHTSAVSPTPIAPAFASPQACATKPATTEALAVGPAACRLLDQEAALYILTLGVAEGFRHLGIASRLVAFVVQHARDSLCRAVYLHVIDYNKAAIQFYRRNDFEELALIRRFYKIK